MSGANAPAATASRHTAAAVPSASALRQQLERARDRRTHKVREAIAEVFACSPSVGTVAVCDCPGFAERHEHVHAEQHGVGEQGDEVSDMKALHAFARVGQSTPSAETKNHHHDAASFAQTLREQIPNLIGSALGSDHDPRRMGANLMAITPAAQQAAARDETGPAMEDGQQHGHGSAVGAAAEHLAHTIKEHVVDPILQIAGSEALSDALGGHGHCVHSSDETPEMRQADARREKIGLPSRFMAAKAAVKERTTVKALAQFFLMFRILEMCANCGLLAISLWWIEPFVMIFPFLILWYLPAVFRSGFYEICRKKKGYEAIAWWQPWSAPLCYPILLFAADDFSWLRIHPKQRPALIMYAIYISRVLLLLAVITTCSSDTAAAGACRAIINDAADADERSPLEHLHKVFAEVLVGSTADLLINDAGDPVHFLTVFWAATAELIMTLSLAWVVLASGAVLIAWRCTPRWGARNEALLTRIDCISHAIDRAAKLEVAEQCMAELRNLEKLDKSQGGCQTFEFTTYLLGGPNPVLIVGIALLHCLLRFFTAYTFASSYTLSGIVCAAVLFLSAFMTLVRLRAIGLASPSAIVREVRKSLAFGILTPRLYEVLKTDKGVLVLPALIFSLGDLPWTIYLNGHGPKFQLAQAICAILGFVETLAGSGSFVFQQFDLGLEVEGLGSIRAPLARCGSAKD